MRAERLPFAHYVLKWVIPLQSPVVRAARNRPVEPKDDILLVVDDAPDVARALRVATVAVVDDDVSVHEGTRFALRDYALNGVGLEILSAYTAQEARELLAQRPETAVVLLDVVMETDRAGLDLVEYIRRDLGNDRVRIILRTGQPGQAPEREVVLRYDINDYKAKTELTADKLFTTLTAALRSHEQILRIGQTNRALETMLDFTGRLFGQRSIHRLAEEVLQRLAQILGVQAAGLVALDDPADPRRGCRVIAGAGREGGSGGLAAFAGLPAPQQEEIAALLHGPGGLRSLDPVRIAIATEGGRRIAIMLAGGAASASPDPTLLRLFIERAGAAFDMVMLQEELRIANEQLEQRVAQRTGELMAANRRLETQYARARRTAAFQNEVLGIVAHDLKNPLSVIMGRTEILQETLGGMPGVGDAARNQLDKIRDSARRLAGMVDALIKDAMIDAIALPVRREETDFVALVREAVEANRPLAERKQQVIELVAPDVLPALCDHERMREAVDNLVSNAVKYSPPGGRIVVTVSSGNGEAAVAVKDSGPGLSPEDYPRLFGRFQRLSARPTGGENSTGLGLFIAKRIVDLHEGRLDVSSAGQGAGSVFTIAIRAAGRHEAAA